MRKTFKYRLFPTAAQCTALQAQLDACRWVYNKTLEVRRAAWEEEQRFLSLYDTQKLLTQWKREADTRWLQQGHAQALQEAQKRVDLAFRAFFRRVREQNGKAGYPRFKSRRRYDSFTYPQERANWRLLGERRIRLSKIGDVRIKLHRPLEGECKTLTIRRDGVGNWYACFSCIVEPDPLPPTDKAAGVDLGLTTFATLSDGSRIERERWMERDEQDLKRLQRRVSRLEKGSPQRREAVRALRHAHQRVANRRRNFAHQWSRRLVNAYQFLAFEKLDITAMQQDNAGCRKSLNRGIADVAWARFVQFTAYKAEEAGRGFAQVDPRNTTQLCSDCGALVRKDLSVRVHDCPYCGLVLDRDQNAALNILARGLAGVGPDP